MMRCCSRQNKFLGEKSTSGHQHGMCEDLFVLVVCGACPLIGWRQILPLLFRDSAWCCRGDNGDLSCSSQLDFVAHQQDDHDHNEDSDSDGYYNCNDEQGACRAITITTPTAA